MDQLAKIELEKKLVRLNKQTNKQINKYNK